MRDHIAGALDPDAPALSRRILTELADITPATTAETDTRVALCLDPARATPRPADLLAATVEVGRRLPAIENNLAACGVAVLGRASTGWLADRNTALPWSEAGPVAATERWDSYRHEGATSVTWALREAPRQAVGAGVLAPLLAPGPFPRRTTWLYQPYPAEQAAAKVPTFPFVCGRQGRVNRRPMRRFWQVCCQALLR